MCPTLQIYSTDASMMPDEKVSRLHKNAPGILEMVGSVPDFDQNGLGLIVTLLTANIRSLKYTSAMTGPANGEAEASS